MIHSILLLANPIAVFLKIGKIWGLDIDLPLKICVSPLCLSKIPSFRWKIGLIFFFCSLSWTDQFETRAVTGGSNFWQAEISVQRSSWPFNDFLRQKRNFIWHVWKTRHVNWWSLISNPIWLVDGCRQFRICGRSSIRLKKVKFDNLSEKLKGCCVGIRIADSASPCLIRVNCFTAAVPRSNGLVNSCVVSVLLAAQSLSWLQVT